MITQTLALLLDAYRDLQSKKMFWIVLIISSLVMLAFGALGVNDHTLTFLAYEPFGHDIPQARLQYKLLFSNLAVGIWLTWIAALLALISTAGIFPEFLSAGAIDLYLAKPISRLRLFFTKYLAGLLFVTLQVSLFCLVSFFVLGFRGGVWEPGLFWAIPLIVLCFSYLFAICVFLGVLTRSTVAALMLTLLAWSGIFVVDFIDNQLNTVSQMMSMRYEHYDYQLTDLNAQLQRTPPATNPSPDDPYNKLVAERDALEKQRDQFKPSDTLATTRTVLFTIKTFVPKTRETTNLLDRVLFKDEDLKDASKHDDPSAAPPLPPSPRRGRGPGFSNPEAAITQLRLQRAHSPLWIIGTSLACEALLLALAAYTFCRRDY